jgi:hypothetical protein
MHHGPSNFIVDDNFYLFGAPWQVAGPTPIYFRATFYLTRDTSCEHTLNITVILH